MTSPHKVKHARLIFDKILILQKRAIRMIFYVDRCDHAVPYFLMLMHILPITFLYYESIASLTHDIDKGNAPLNLFEKSLFIRIIHDHLLQKTSM